MPAKKKKSSPEELVQAYFDQIEKAIGITLVDPVAQAYEAEQAAAEAEEEEAA